MLHTSTPLEKASVPKGYRVRRCKKRNLHRPPQVPQGKEKGNMNNTIKGTATAKTGCGACDNVERMSADFFGYSADGKIISDATVGSVSFCPICGRQITAKKEEA